MIEEMSVRLGMDGHFAYSIKSTNRWNR